MVNIRHRIFDFQKLLELAGPDFNEQFEEQWMESDDGVAAAITCPDYGCSDDCRQFDEIAVQIRKDPRWAGHWAGTVFSVESPIDRLLGTTVDPELLAALWDPEHVRATVERFDVDLITDFIAAVAPQVSRHNFVRPADVSPYVNSWLEPWRFAALHGHAVGYCIG